MEEDTLDIIYNDADNNDAIPLLLMHDGGGTIFSYWTLKDLQRHLYAIAYPGWNSGEAVDGGIPALAKMYCVMLRKHLPKGPILLGGWSLGSYLALEMARLLAGDEDYQVAGLVMIDAANPSVNQKWTGKINSHVESLLRPQIRPKIMKSMDIAFEMVDSWKPPTWDGNTKCPPAVLLRAELPVPTSDTDEKAVVDLLRQDRNMGWDKYEALKILHVMDILDHHHFDIFRLDTTDEISEQISDACDLLCAQYEKA